MEEHSISIIEPIKGGGLLTPAERISEFLFGLMMALTFTCTVSVINTNRTELRDILIAAVGCNIAWGLVNAIIYILHSLATMGHGSHILNFVRKTSDSEKARTFIADALPPVIASVLKTDDIELIRKRLLTIPDAALPTRLKMKDFKMAIGIFFLGTISTLPVVIPFIFIHHIALALRISNLVAVLLMFTCGWLLGKYGSYNKIVMALSMSLLGCLLVLLTIELGG